MTGVVYETDSVTKLKADLGADDLAFNRLPWVHLYGKVQRAPDDRGSATKPIVGLSSGHGLGLVPKVGLSRYKYEFRRAPYASLIEGEVAYSSTRRLEAGVAMDTRFESSGFHLPVTAGVTKLGVVEFRGFGNDVPNLTGRFYDVRQRQWSFHPAIAFSFGPQSDVSVGPIVRYTTTDSVVNRFISRERPYGFDRIRQVLAIRGGRSKLFGDFPYFDAAFLGGSGSLRTEHRQRFAGGAAIHGTTELRVPIAEFPLVLPLNVGAIGFVDFGRVYLSGESPGGWHKGAGAGFWIGVLRPETGINVSVTNNPDRRIMTRLGFAF